jgi:hypothetical protein
VITAVIGSGVLSLAWSVAQMGWVVGPIVLLLFALVTYYTALLLTDCYRSPDPVSGKRNYTYMDAVKANLGKYYIKHFSFNHYRQIRFEEEEDASRSSVLLRTKSIFPRTMMCNQISKLLNRTAQLRRGLKQFIALK